MDNTVDDQAFVLFNFLFNFPFNFLFNFPFYSPFYFLILN